MANEDIRKELEVVKGDIAKLRADIAELAGMLKDEGAKRIDDTRETVQEELEAQRERFREALGRARERGRTAADEVELHIAEHPLGSLLTAFGVGYVMAKMSGHHS